MSNVQRNTIVSPFQVKTPLLISKPKSNMKVRGEETDENQASSGVAWAHIKWFQEVATAANASPQITSTIPASSVSDGEAGTIAFDANFLYVCIALNKWRRIALAAF